MDGSLREVCSPERESAQAPVCMIGQLAALERIAIFSAQLRGHELGEWLAGEGLVTTQCVKCRRELRVYFSLVQPEMDGPALECECERERDADASKLAGPAVQTAPTAAS
jgi:hypothetical protein